MLVKLKILLILFVVLVNCAEKELDPNNPQLSYSIAKEPYDGNNYDIALRKLGEFRSRFPYSKYAVEAELLIANCHFELGHYVESSAAYALFVKLHPKHPQVDYALFQVGMSYWKDAPSEIDREQEYTSIALKEWKVLLDAHPNSSYSKQALDFVEKGNKRIADSEEFIACFYCKQEIWHACAYRYMQVIDKFPEDPKRLKQGLEKTSHALKKIAEQKVSDKEDKNLFFRNLSKEELLKKSQEYKDRALKL